jgi:hypothetical protein
LQQRTPKRRHWSWCDLDATYPTSPPPQIESYFTAWPPVGGGRINPTALAPQAAPDPTLPKQRVVHRKQHTDNILPSKHRLFGSQRAV